MNDHGSKPDPAKGKVGTLAALLIAASVLTGWFLLDVFIFGVSSEPALIGDLLPASLAVIAVGSLMGPLCAPRPILAPFGMAALVAVSKLPAFTSVFFQESEVWLLRGAALVWGAIAVSAVLRRRFGLGAMRTALCLGALIALLQTSYRIGPPVLGAWFGLAAGACLLVGFVPAAGLRMAATAVILAFPGYQVVKQVVSPRRALRPDLEQPTARAEPDAPNLVLIVIDTLRADHMSCYGHRRETTPGLDAFARDHATLFTQARSTSPFTLSSHASLFTGLLAVEHGATHARPAERPIRPDVTTIGERLREVGYQTGAIIANGLYLDPHSGLDRGFEHFNNTLGGQSNRGEGYYLALAQLVGRQMQVGHVGHRPASRITDLALDWLDDRRGDPFFLTVNYLDVHGPYYPIAPFDKAFSDRQPHDALTPDMDIIPLLYDRELLYTDAHVTRLIDGLRERDAFDNTVVIVTSDHGEALGERNFPEHCWTLYENVTHVPLLVKPVGERREAVNDTRISGAEVHDLALRELGLYAPDQRTSTKPTDILGEWYGAELISWEPNYAGEVHIELYTDALAWFEGTRKVIVRNDEMIEIYDLEQDPKELSPIEPSDAERQAILARARKWWDEHPPDPLVPIELDAETLEGMRALGYMGEEDEDS